MQLWQVSIVEPKEPGSGSDVYFTKSVRASDKPEAMRLALADEGIHSYVSSCIPISEAPRAATPAAAEPVTGHKPNCEMGKSTWSGSPNPNDPDNSWICDECEGIIPSAS